MTASDPLAKVMAQRLSGWSRQLPSPISIPGLMTIKTLADVRKLLVRLPDETRQEPSWQHLEKCLQEAVVSGDAQHVFEPLMILLRIEGVPHQ
jgi:hypothetical protein